MGTLRRFRHRHLRKRRIQKKGIVRESLSKSEKKNTVPTFLRCPKIAAVKPAAFINNFFCFVWHLIITFHYIISAAADFPNSIRRYWFIGTRVNYPNLDCRERLSYSLDPEFDRIVHSCLGHARGSFRESIDTGNLM